MKLKLSQRPQFNVRLSPELLAAVKSEIERQGRKRDVVAARVFKAFLAMRKEQRDAICCGEKNPQS